MTLRLEQIACERGESLLFKEINVELHAGDALWVQGENGSGKTSLLRILCGLLAPVHGSVLWHAQDIRKLGGDYFREVLYRGHLPGIKDDLTALENVFFSARLAGVACNQGSVLQALQHVGLAHLAHLAVRKLSQGQRKRVALARLYLAPLPKLLILDEPFSALDGAAIDLLANSLNQHLANGGMVVYSTHQPVSLAAHQLHTLVLNQHRAC